MKLYKGQELRYDCVFIDYGNIVKFVKYANNAFRSSKFPYYKVEIPFWSRFFGNPNFVLKNTFNGKDGDYYALDVDINEQVIGDKTYRIEINIKGANTPIFFEIQYN